MKNIKKIDSVTKLLIFALIYLSSIFAALTCKGQERVPELENIIFQKVNEFRMSEGLLPVKWNDNVYNAAEHHALYISERGIQVSHYEIDDKNAWGIECITNINFVWYKGDLEKIAEWTVNAWINSPTHRKGLLFDYDGSIGTLKFGAVSVLKVTDSCEWARPVLVLVN